MIAALKRLHLQETVVLDDDSNTMIGLVSRRVIPILVKNDGAPMLESMDMVVYVDSIGERILTGPERNAVSAWSERVSGKLPPLTQPRYPLLGLPEFATLAALDHYHLRKRKVLGDFVELRANTRHYINEVMPDLEELDGLIQSPLAINGTLSLDDIRGVAAAALGGRRQGIALPEQGSRLFRNHDEAHGLRRTACRIRRFYHEAHAHSCGCRGP